MEKEGMTSNTLGKILESIFELMIYRRKNKFTHIENTRCSDTHITILPEFVMPAGREAEFKAGFSKFYDATKVDFAI